MNEEKQKLQDEAVKLFSENKNILLNWATGSSKSLAAIKCLESFEGWNSLVLVAEELHKQNWKDEFIKWGYEEKLQYVTFECYASMHKHTGNDYDVVIFDECHHISELRSEVLKGLRYCKSVLLSATLDSKVRGRIEETISFVTSTITLDDAIERGLLPAPEVYLIPVTMDSKIKSVPSKYGKKEVLLTQLEAYQKFEKTFVYWRQMKEKLREEGKPTGWIDNKVKILGSQRKKFFAECKTQAVEDLIVKLQVSGTRFICFTGSVDQSLTLSPSRSINSFNSKKRNEEILEIFNKKDINSIFMIKMGREGLNLVDIEAGIIVQLDSGSDEGRSFLQILGRALRSLNPVMYIFYLKGTEDERYLRIALKNIDSKYIIKEK